jgi:hypothetical protein
MRSDDERVFEKLDNIFLEYRISSPVWLRKCELIPASRQATVGILLHGTPPPPQTMDQVTWLSLKSCDVDNIISNPKSRSRDFPPGPRTNVVAPRSSFGAPRLAEPVVILHQTSTLPTKQSQSKHYHIMDGYVFLQSTSLLNSAFQSR